MVGEIGGNDYLGPWVFNMQTEQQVTAYVPTVVEAIKNATEVTIDISSRTRRQNSIAADDLINLRRN